MGKVFQGSNYQFQRVFHLKAQFQAMLTAQFRILPATPHPMKPIQITKHSSGSIGHICFKTFPAVMFQINQESTVPKQISPAFILSFNPGTSLSNSILLAEK